MNCKKYVNKFNNNDMFCSKCEQKGTIIDNNIKINHFKSFNVLFTISIILFLIIMLINLFFIKLYVNEKNGMAGLFLLASISITYIPSLALIILSIINIISIIKHKKNNVDIPQKIKILGVINATLVPIIIIIFYLASGLKESQNKNLMKEKLMELYGSSYEVLDTHTYSNTGGEYYMEYLLKLSNFEYPIVAYLDLRDNSYKDNYDELNQTAQLNYQTYIDNVFNDKTIALMNLYEGDYYKRINLNIFMTNEKLNNKNILKYNIEQIINKYTNQFEEYDFNVSIYFTEKIDTTKKENYYILLTEDVGKLFYKKFSKKVNKDNLKVLYVYIRENTNISQEIERSLENIINISDGY